MTVSLPHLPLTQPQSRTADLKAAAQGLEAAFVAEMLKGAGYAEAPDAFGGGAGEDHFATFLRQETANAIVARGGFGLAESIVAALARRAGHAG